jgi:hypothetical protein
VQIPYKGIQTNFNAQLPAQGAPLSNFQLGVATVSHFQPLQSVNLNTSKWLMEQAILSNALKNQHNGNGVLHNYEQQEDSTLESMINGKGNITLMDDYRWLDEYQPSPVTASGVVSIVSLNDSAVRYNGAMDFPFPGKQIPNVPAQVVDDKWMDFKHFEHARLNSEQQKPAMIPDQFQAQTLWPPGYHV